MLDVIAPPYTSDFVQLFLPILENDSIAGTIKTEGEHDPVTEFIGKACVDVPWRRRCVRLPSCGSSAMTVALSQPCDCASHCSSLQV